MAIATLSPKSVSPGPSPCEKMSKSYNTLCQKDFAAISIQSAARVYLAKRQWEELYVKHIEQEILRLKQQHKINAKIARKRKILDRLATTIQTLVRGYIVRNNYRKTDKEVRGGAEGLSLMESIRKRRELRKRIESLKKQVSEAREAQKSTENNDEKNDNEVSVRKVAQLKATQHRLNIKAMTLEAVTRPLQEKFDNLRAEQKKFKNKYDKINSKNESRKYANESKAEELAEKHKAIDDTRDDLVLEMDRVSKERSKAQHRLDTLVETSSAYASLGGMSERDAAAFADEVTRIGNDAHKKAKLFRDSLRCLGVASNDKIATAPPATTEVAPSSRTKDGAVSPKPKNRGRGKVLRNMLRDRSEKNRSLSPNGSFTSSGSSSEDSRRHLKGQRYLVKRSDKRENPLMSKKERSKRALGEEPSQKNESVYVKRDRNRTPSPARANGSANNTPVISNKEKFKGSTTVTPKSNDKAKIDKTETPKSHTPKISNKRTPKTTNVSEKSSKPMRRTYSEANTSISEMKKGLRKVLSERMIVSLDDDIPTSPPGRRLSKLKDELRNELSRKNSQKGSSKVRSKSQDRKEPKKSKSLNDPKKSKSKNKEKSHSVKLKKSSNSRSPNRSEKKSNSRSPSRSKKSNNSRSPNRSNSRSHSSVGIVQNKSENNSRSNRSRGSDRSNSKSRSSSGNSKTPGNTKNRSNDKTISNGKNRSKSRSRSRSRSRDLAEENIRIIDKQFSGSNGKLRGKRPNSRKDIHEELPNQSKRDVTAAKLEAKKRSYLKRANSLTESKMRKELLDKCRDSEEQKMPRSLRNFT